MKKGTFHVEAVRNLLFSNSITALFGCKCVNVNFIDK